MNCRRLLVSMVAGACLLARPSSAAIQSEAGPLPATDLFQNGLIPRMRIELSSDAIASLERNPRTYVPGNVREGTWVYTNVSIRLKGGPGSFRPLEDRPGFTVNFERLNPGQKFNGLRNMRINNSVQASTYLQDKNRRIVYPRTSGP